VPDKEGWKKIAEEFQTKWNFPFCCGSIDGKHVRIRCPGQSGSHYFNYKGFFSVNLFAVTDASYKFTLVEIGNEGSASDGGILMRSKIYQMIENGDKELPSNEKLPHTDDHTFPYVFLGDDAFPLKPHLMKPYSGKSVNQNDRIFNYRLSRARLVVENSFGILAARWRIYHTTIDAKLDLIKLIVRSTVILHNFLMKQKDLINLTIDKETESGIVRGNWRDVIVNDTSLVRIRKQGSNNYSADSSQIRDNFKNYFVSESGSVSWQLDHVLQGYD